MMRVSAYDMNVVNLGKDVWEVIGFLDYLTIMIQLQKKRFEVL
jgi:hypothetical protein